VPSPLIKHFSKTDAEDGRKLFWGRAAEDGAPYRGEIPPLMPEEEYESRVARVNDFRNGFFNVKLPEENKKFCEIMECCANGWFRLNYIERFWHNSECHYIEWIEIFLEDGTRTPYVPLSGT
jgi:hypothetical protein